MPKVLYVLDRVAQQPYPFGFLARPGPTLQRQSRWRNQLGCTQLARIKQGWR